MPRSTALTLAALGAKWRLTATGFEIWIGDSRTLVRSASEALAWAGDYWSGGAAFGERALGEHRS